MYSFSPIQMQEFHPFSRVQQVMIQPPFHYVFKLVVGFMLSNHLGSQKLCQTLLSNIIDQMICIPGQWHLIVSTLTSHPVCRGAQVRIWNNTPPSNSLRQTCFFFVLRLQPHLPKHQTIPLVMRIQVNFVHRFPWCHNTKTNVSGLFLDIFKPHLPAKKGFQKS